MKIPTETVISRTINRVQYTRLYIVVKRFQDKVGI